MTPLKIAELPEDRGIKETVSAIHYIGINVPMTNNDEEIIEGF